MALAILITGCVKESEDSGGPKLAGVVFQEDQFFRLILIGMEDAADQVEAELFEANSASKPDKEMQLINNYIQRGVDAILISPLSGTASKTALKRAHDKGIKIITYNTTIEGDIPSANVESDQVDLGAQTGQAAVAYIKESLGGKAKVAILAFKSQAPEQSDARVRGFKQAVTALDGVEVVAEQDAWMADQAVKVAGDIMTANPDIDLIWAANEGGTAGAVLAVRNAGKASEVAVFGTDTSDQLLQFLQSEDNILQAITGQRPYEIGQKAVEAALKVLKGEAVERNIIMPGVLLTRSRPDEIQAYQQQLKERTGK
jgi:ABC-type sugar transport system substrate-binding protein